jgi:DNA-binding XRE family transcriptional regulator
MNLQIIKSINGQAEYVLLPIHAYEALKPQITKLLKDDENEYEAFIPEDYVSNPVALLRIKSHVTQKSLAKALKVSQAYISKLETQEVVSAKALNNVKQAILAIQSKK